MSGVLSTAGRLIDIATSEESLCLKTTAIRLTTEKNHENPQGNDRVLAIFDLSKRKPCFGQPQWVCYIHCPAVQAPKTWVFFGQHQCLQTRLPTQLPAPAYFLKKGLG